MRKWIKDTLAIFAVGAERGLVVDGALTLEQARVAAMDLLAKLAHGHDPAVEKARATIETQNTFGALIEP